MRRLLPLLMLLGLLASCASTAGIVRSGFQTTAVQEMQFATPIAQIALIKQGNRPVSSPEATFESTRLMRKILINHQPELRLRGEMVIPDSLQLQAYQEIYRAVEGLEKHLRLDTGAHLPVVDYLLTRQNQRYLLVTATQGLHPGTRQLWESSSQEHRHRLTDYGNDGARGSEG